MITHQDLVEWQILVASGLPLPKTQKQLSIDGHAFEARIYAENPRNNFLPGTGSLSLLRTASQSLDVRVDTGVREGDQVSIFYDPMIAKLVVWGPDRESALRKLSRTLMEYKIAPLQTNIEFLVSLANHPDFMQGNVHTGFIEEHKDSLFESVYPPTLNFVMVAITKVLKEQQQEQSRTLSREDKNSPWGFADGFSLSNSQPSPVIDFTCESVTYGTQVYIKSHPLFHLDANKMDLHTYRIVLKCPKGYQEVFDHVSANFNENDSVLTISISDQLIKATVFENPEKPGSYHIISSGKHWHVETQKPNFSVSTSESGSEMKAPMPGKVIKVNVSVGDHVKKGQELMILEAMKMEHKICSPRDGVVKNIRQVGLQVEVNSILASLAPHNSESSH
eukprot:TRINITY_DN8581_c0_g1_i6.p1 TRINITY_DN8581_c0_g1~~TRINITY_DN8581_c0_g1_i6.p1  ORF type:complete len:392 (+),score=66.93 TRINITY_DN8581_c0_g1_i6:1131-2306(+)